MTTLITDKESEALKKFQERIPDLLKSMTEEQKKDYNLLRWLRARELNLAKAEDMLRKHMAWRKENDIDTIMSWRPPARIKEVLPFQISGKDNDGCYIYICPAGQWDIRELCDTGYKDTLRKSSAQFLELISDFIRQSAKDSGKPITQFVMIHDMEGYSMRQLLSSDVRESNMEVMKVMEANYPEIMKKVTVVNAPKIFSIFFNLIKPLLSAHTVSKISIFDSNRDAWRQAVLQGTHPDELPSYYGGTNTTSPDYDIDDGIVLYPRPPTYSTENFKTVLVAALRDHSITLEVTRPRTTLSWNFKTDDYDIGFKFLHEDTTLFQCSRCDSHLNVQKGLYKCEKTGKYTLWFNNTYSKLRSKTLHYYVHQEDSSCTSENNN